MQRTSLLFFLLICACTPMIWVSDTKPPEVLYSDQYACKQEALQIYPMVIVSQSQPGMFLPTHTYCNKHESKTFCTTHPGVYFPPNYSQYDANKSDREKMVAACLGSRGWYLRKKN